MSFAVGSLVRARDREWVVLPESSGELLVLRPLGGSDDELAGVLTALEPVTPAEFPLPDPSHRGDHRSCSLLRDAMRLGFRSSAGPFRSFGRIAVTPRPYQLVPLLMGLKLDPVRLLIADDVGIGKTVEACLIARELLDRGEITRLAVLCPPHLADQWQSEMRQKFNINAVPVLASTATRLERDCAFGESIFDRNPFVIVSLDFIKSDRRRDEFLRGCPDMVIVDEAHTCAYGAEGRGRHQRHDLVTRLSMNPDRHVILVTATPHSGNEAAFQSLLAFLNPDFRQLPDDLSASESGAIRQRPARDLVQRLARHLVQRKRDDIRDYLGADTRFPVRDKQSESELTYLLSTGYKTLFDKALKYARETVTDAASNERTRRVRWWSAVALLRALSSSPAAAAETMRNRSSAAEADTIEEIDEIGRRTVLDPVDDEVPEGADVSPGADPSGQEEAPNVRPRLLAMAREAEALMGAGDNKLREMTRIVGKTISDGYNPIVFCSFIATAEYVADALREALPSNVAVAAVTGTLPPAEREVRIAALAAESGRRVLVCTDCLSEGINLQEHFDAVIHYDLPWNPTRLEQREGRVDRFGQPKSQVRTITFWGSDTRIDGIVLDVLIRKHKNIRSSLGISVSVPIGTEQVLEAIFEGLLLREDVGSVQGHLPGFEELLRDQKTRVDRAYDEAAARETKSRSRFAQHSIKVDDVQRELDVSRGALGASDDVAEFVTRALRDLGAAVSVNGACNLDLGGVPSALREALGCSMLKARFDQPVQEGETFLHRTDPFVEGLAQYVLETALDNAPEAVARRCGAIRTKDVATRTTLLLLRCRFHIVTAGGGARGGGAPLLAEDALLLAFSGAPSRAEWLDDSAALALLHAQPSGNISPDESRSFLARLISDFDALRPHLDEQLKRKAEELREAHVRVRSAAKLAAGSVRVQPQLPADVVGAYVFLPDN